MRSRLSYSVHVKGEAAFVAVSYFDLAGERAAEVSVRMAGVEASATLPADTPPVLLARLAERGASFPILADVASAAASDWKWRSVRLMSRPVDRKVS